MELSHITTTQKIIIHYYYTFRFLNSIHIQQLLKHQSRQYANDLLKNLVKKDYLKAKTRKDIHDPITYYIFLNGIRFLKTQDYAEKSYLKKLYQEKRLSDTFAEKCGLIADTYLYLEKKYKNTKEKLTFYTQSEFPADGDIKELNPDFGYELETKRKTTNFTCCVIDLTMPKNRIYWKIKKYLDFFVEEDEESNHIIIICPTEDYFRSARRSVRRLIEELGTGDLSIHVTTWEKMRRGDIGERIEIID